MPPTERQPGTDRVAPDPAASYGREKPALEPGQGRLDNNIATPTSDPDRQQDAVTNRQPPRQLNTHDDNTRADHAQSAGAPLEVHDQPDHSMLDEEPDGWDQAPTDIKNPQHKRHPRHDGKGGTP